jgi:hypothetical protein
VRLGYRINLSEGGLKKARMMVNLYSVVEELFSGVVGFVYNYFYSLFVLVRYPVRGPLWLSFRFKKRSDQVGPHSMLFVSVLLMRLLSSDIQWPLSTLVNWSLGQELRDDMQQIAITTLVTIVAVDLGLRGYCWLMGIRRSRRRRRLVEMALYALAPAPLVLLMTWLVLEASLEASFAAFQDF